MDRSGHRKNSKRDGMEMGEKKKEKVINFANSTLLDYPPLFGFNRSSNLSSYARVHKIIRTGERMEGRATKLKVDP